MTFYKFAFLFIERNKKIFDLMELLDFRCKDSETKP